MNLRLRLESLLLAAAVSVLLAGCVNVAGASLGASTIVFLVALLGLGIAACSDDMGEGTGWHIGEDTGKDVGGPDAPDVEAGGNWGPCCEGGQVSSCYCPPGAACNYGWYDDCGDGTCAMEPDSCDIEDAGDASDTEDTSDVADTSDAADTADVPDTSDSGDSGDARDGTWQSCCQNGQVQTCFCPTGTACNYGWYTDCGDGACVLGNVDQCSKDAGQ